MKQLRKSAALKQLPTGAAMLLLSLMAPALTLAQTHAAVGLKTNATPAQLAFERFKELEGSWKGRSTKGWEEIVSYKTIAGGSVVIETSFDAHPNETMMTMIHMDGDRLLLTHYCVAKNQPRLVATSFADEGKTVTFTFLDGANLPSRDAGHMDKVIFRFIDDNHVSSQWTWYQNRKENWMEEILLERKS
jgi:hypothetical protein